MLPSTPPLKRKNEDPNNESSMLNDSEENDKPSCSSKRPRQDNEQNSPSNARNVSLDLNKRDEQRLDRLREIISREFSREIKSKEAQLEMIDERLEEASNLLERLRYAIVAEYYKKQEQIQTMTDVATTVRPESLKVGNIDQMQQIPLHPSLKKIIGKRPQNLEEIMRACPKRKAAKNASHVLNTKSAAERREERRLQNIIREKGLVIDHSKQNIKLEPAVSSTTDSQVNLTASKDNNRTSPIKSSTPHVLNNVRTSKKFKCLFVVGNTSKYIGKSEESSQTGNNTFSHKWLVYVQTKDTKESIEKYVKKVRFFLHPSYRPNDVVDILESPFQVARRGWGEFPMRIQLFFHEHFHQKPLQLVHNIVLDVTKSGRHTLGAETVLEVWLRNEIGTRDIQDVVKNEEKSPPKIVSPVKTSTTTTTFVAPDINRKPRKISLNIKDTFDDNFFDFLNKIEESRTSICADIEKIEPTLMVNEQLEPQFSNITRSPISKDLPKSPLKTPSSQISPLKNSSTHLSLTSPPKAIKDATNKLSAIVNQVEKLSDETLDFKEMLDSKLVNPTNLNQMDSNNTCEIVASSKPPQNISKLVSTEIVTTSNSMKITPVNNNSNSTSSSSAKLFNNASGTVILPLAKKVIHPQQNKSNPKTQMQPNFANNAVFQKKTIQIVNAQGQVKTVQMLIASSKCLTSTTATKPQTSIATSSGIRIVTSKTFNTNTTNSISDSTKFSTHLLSQQTATSKCDTISPTTSTHITAGNSSTFLSQQQSNENSNSIRSARPLTSSSTKNVVFQKEGRLYIIDPLQMKLKQQRKNQVSLLKPQIKQQNRQTQQRSSSLRSVDSDHDYAPPPSLQQQPMQIQNIQSNFLNRPPQVHLGIRESRECIMRGQDHLKWQRWQLEKKFNDTDFASMRSAVEFLLRRLPLIVSDNNSPAKAFPFVRGTLREFESLPAFKQRSFEWLRAKCIARLLQNSKSLQALNATGDETFWSTREIATFARFYGFTPPIKSLQQIETNLSDKETVPGSTFSALIKTEMKSQMQLEYDSLSSAYHIKNWIDNTLQRVKEVQQKLSSEEEIIIDDSDDSSIEKTTSKERVNSEATVTQRIYGSPLKIQSNRDNISYLPPPAHLETAFEYVGEVCQDISVRLRPEEIVPGIIHPSTQTVLARISQLFIERLLRQTIANKNLNELEQQRSCSRLPQNNAQCIIASHDIRKTISQSSEFNFLTNDMGFHRISSRVKNE